MLNIYNNSMDIFFDLLLKFYSIHIVTILPVLFFFGVVISTNFIFFSSNLGQKIIKTAGKIGTGLVLGVTGLESTLNLVDRLKGSGNSGNSGGSNKNSDNKDDKKDDSKKK